MKPKNFCITVIVAVYNVEKYIDKCLESISGQSYTNLQIVVVDDGSTDASGRICDKWAEKDGRIQVIHKANGGVSSARNAGLDMATGDYVTFVDGDDYLEADMYEKMLQSGSAKMVVCSFRYVYDRKIKSVKSPLMDGMRTREEYMDGLLKDSFAFYYSVVWNKLFDRTLIQKHHLRFDERWKVMEDFRFVLQVLPHIEDIVVCTEALYNYRKNNYGTATNREIPFEESYGNRSQGYLWLKECLTECNCYEQKKKQLVDYLIRYLASQYMKAFYCENRKERFKEHKLIKGRDFICKELEQVPISFRWGRKWYWNTKYLAEGMIQKLRAAIRNR